MNKEQAEIYVQFGIDHMKKSGMSSKKCFELLPVNLFIFGLAIAFYRELTFAIIVATVALLNIVLSVVFVKKWSIIVAFIGSSSQLLFFCIALNCGMFGAYKLAEMFVWWQYLVLISIQIIAFPISFVIVKKLANRFDANKQNQNSRVIAITGAIAGSVAGFSYALTMILSRFFSEEVFISTVLFVISLLINFIIYLVCFGIVMAFHRVYLIKKYDLFFYEEELSDNITKYVNYGGGKVLHSLKLLPKKHLT